MVRLPRPPHGTHRPALAGLTAMGGFTLAEVLQGRPGALVLVALWLVCAALIALAYRPFSRTTSTPNA